VTHAENGKLTRIGASCQPKNGTWGILKKKNSHRPQVKNLKRGYLDSLVTLYGPTISVSRQWAYSPVILFQSRIQNQKQ
jgi:hypothetical protein